MRLMRVGPPGSERPVLGVADGRHYDLTGLTDDIDPAFLAGDGIDQARSALAAGRLPELPQAEVAGQRIGAPLARPGAVLCIGQNYAEHAAESGA